MTLRLLALLLAAACIRNGTAQVTANKLMGDKHEALRDSLHSTPYPYVLPILGAKAWKAGFDLPYSAGIGVNYLWQQAGIEINDLAVGFNNGPMHDLSEVVRFNDATATTSGISIRPDVWVLPFLNVYGILARGQNRTAIDFGVWAPDSSGYKEVFSAKTTADLTAQTFGLGITPTIGVGGFWMAFDMNFSWSDIDALDEPAFVYVFDPRIGKQFKLKGEQSLSAWVGGFRVHLNSGTNGNIALGDLFDASGLEGKIASGEQQVADASQQVDAWWTGLTPAQQANPVNHAKHDAATRALGTAGALLDGLSGAAGTLETSTVQYSLNKHPAQLWCLTLGAQYQLNKHWMLRGEYGFIGERQQFIGGLQYRFGL